MHSNLCTFIDTCSVSAVCLQHMVTQQRACVYCSGLFPVLVLHMWLEEIKHNHIVILSLSACMWRWTAS